MTEKIYIEVTRKYMDVRDKNEDILLYLNESRELGSSMWFIWRDYLLVHIAYYKHLW